MPEPTLYLIDISSYIFRAYHAVRALRTSAGFPTNAIHGYTSMLFKFLKDYKPKYVGIVFDSRGKTFRDDIYPLYKANRTAPPDELEVQFPKIYEISDALGIPQVQMDGYEADDLMGTISKSLGEKGITVVLVTGDKDFCQLVTEKVTLYDTMREKKTGIPEVIGKFGVTPDRVTDVLALWGDSIDNIPGVKGIGEKTAIELIKKFGSLDGVFEGLDSLSPKQKALIEASRENAILSKKLATIETAIPMDVSLEMFEYGGFDGDRLRKIFEELEFKSLVRDLAGLSKTYERTPLGRAWEKGGLPAESETGTTVAEVTESPQAPIVPAVSYDNYHLVLTEEQLDKLIQRINETKEISIDLETTSLNPMTAYIVGIALSPAPHEAYYIPVGHRSVAFDASKQLKTEFVLEKLKPIIEDEAIGKVGQNLKYEVVVLERHGVKLRGITCDTMIAAHLLDASRMSYSLDELANLHLGHKTITYRDVTGSGRDKINFEAVEFEKAKVYSCEDADVAMILSKKLLAELEKLDLMKVFKETELEFIEVLAEMEKSGVKVDSQFLNKLSVEFEAGLERLAEEIYSIVGDRFNLGSPLQLREILFNRLGLPSKKLTKSGEASTDVEVLSDLAKLHPVPEKVLEHRGLAKLKSTYVDALPKLINSETGRIHTSFNQAGSATGRVSSSDPNLQNIPIKTAEGKRIREAFIPESGFIMLSADYSQIELRLLAHFSGDQSLTDAFIAGSDIHSRTGAEIFGVHEKLVTPDMRRLAKTINFGIIYGISAFGLAKQLGTSNAVAKSYIDEYFKQYKSVKSYMEQSIEDAKTRGYAATLLGRRRPIPELASKDRNLRSFGERTAINTPIQGTAAEIIKIAMIKIHAKLRGGYKSRMILQVHDELLFEIHENEMEAVSKIVKEEMEGAWKLNVPLRVDMGYGKNWAEAH